MQNNSFSRLGVKLLNKVPSYISNLPKKAFKRLLRKSLLDILEMEDDCIEIPLIINKLGYLKDSNAAAHSVDNDIFYVFIDLSARSKSYIITFIS